MSCELQKYKRNVTIAVVTVWKYENTTYDMTSFKFETADMQIHP